MSDYYELMINTRSVSYELNFNSANPIISLRVNFNGYDLMCEEMIRLKSQDDNCDERINLAIKKITQSMVQHIKKIQDGSIDPTIAFAK